MERIRAFFAGVDLRELFTRRVAGLGPRTPNWFTRLGGSTDNRAEFIRNLGAGASDTLKLIAIGAAVLIAACMLLLGWWLPLLILAIVIPVVLGYYGIAAGPIAVLGFIAIGAYLSQLAGGGNGSDYDAGFSIGGLSFVVIGVCVAFLLRQDWRSLALGGVFLGLTWLILFVLGINEESQVTRIVALLFALVMTFAVIVLYQGVWFNAVVATFGALAVLVPWLLLKGENVETVTDADIEQVFLGALLILLAGVFLFVAAWDLVNPEAIRKRFKPASDDEEAFISNLNGQLGEWLDLSREQRELIVILWPFQREHRLLQLKKDAFVKGALAKADIEEDEAEAAELDSVLVRGWLSEKFVADAVDAGIVRENGRLLKSKLKNIGITNKKIEDENEVTKADYREVLAARRNN